MELKPCPFCGSSHVKQGGDDKVVGVWCENCGASGPNGYLTINGDFDWNTRQPATTQEGWQPIETAPKGKNQPIDLWVIHEGAGLRITNVTHWDCYEGVTHWMPLPAAPDKGAE